MTPVGTYKKVVKLREKIDRDRSKWSREKLRITKERGSLVDNEKVKTLWAKKLPFLKDIEEYEKRVSLYNKSLKGRLNNFIGGFFMILAVSSVCVVISIVLSFL